MYLCKSDIGGAGVWLSPEKVADEGRDAQWQALDLLDNQYRHRGELPSETHVDVVRCLVSGLVARSSHFRGWGSPTRWRRRTAGGRASGRDCLHRLAPGEWRDGSRPRRDLMARLRHGIAWGAFIVGLQLPIL
jgi:hypothetical protein